MLESNDYQLEKCGMNAVQYKGQTATQDNHNGAATPAARLFKILNITSTPDSHQGDASVQFVSVELFTYRISIHTAVHPTL